MEVDTNRAQYRASMLNFETSNVRLDRASRLSMLGNHGQKVGWWVSLPHSLLGMIY